MSNQKTQKQARILAKALEGALVLSVETNPKDTMGGFTVSCIRPTDRRVVVLHVSASMKLGLQGSLQSIEDAGGFC